MAKNKKTHEITENKTGLKIKENGILSFLVNGLEVASADLDDDRFFYLDVCYINKEGTSVENGGYIESSQLINAIRSEFPEWDKYYVSNEGYKEVSDTLDKFLELNARKHNSHTSQSVRVNPHNVNTFVEKYGENFEKCPEANQALVSDIVTAIAGRHNIIISNPSPAVAKLAEDMIRTFTPILPLRDAEEVFEIHNSENENGFFSYDVPVRVPSEKMELADFCGKLEPYSYGEISLAHRGTLILNKAENFRSSVLSMLRVPLENRELTLARAGRTEARKTDFQLVMTTDNILSASFKKKIIGPVFDRMEIRNDGNSQFASMHTNWNVQKIIDAISNAYELQGKQKKTNSRLTDNEINDYLAKCSLNKNYDEINSYLELKNPRESNNMLKVAKTIANMQGIKYMDSFHISSAAQMCPSLVELMQRDIDSKTKSLSLKQLFEHYEEKGEVFDLFGYENIETGARLARIEKSYENFRSKDEKQYFDLYTPDDRLVCCDGETVKVLGEKDGLVFLENENNESDVPYFKLTKEDFDIATFTVSVNQNQDLNKGIYGLDVLDYNSVRDVQSFRDFLNESYPLKVFTSADAKLILETCAPLEDRANHLALKNGKLFCRDFKGDSAAPQIDASEYFIEYGSGKNLVNELLQKTIDQSKKDSEYTKKFNSLIDSTTVNWNTVREKLSDMGWSVHDFQSTKDPAKHIFALYRNLEGEYVSEINLLCAADNPESFAEAYAVASHEYDSDHEAEREMSHLVTEHSEGMTSLDELYRLYADEKENLIRESEALSEFVRNYPEISNNADVEKELDILKEFKGAKIKIVEGKDDCSAQILLASGDTVDFDIDVSDDGDFADRWVGFKYKGSDFDLSIYRDEDDRLFTSVYPVFDGHIDESEYVEISPTITRSLENEIQTESKTFTFDDMKERFESLGYNIESIESHFIEMGKLKVNLSFSTTMGYDIPISFEYEADNPITALESFIKATKEWDVDSHIVSTRERLEQQLISPTEKTIRLELEEAKNIMTNDAIELQKFRDDYLNNKLPKQKVLATQKVLGMVEMELNEYSSDNVDLIENEENGKLDIMYHSDSNSYLIKETGIKTEDLNISDLIKGLNKYHVGHNLGIEPVNPDVEKKQIEPEKVSSEKLEEDFWKKVKDLTPEFDNNPVLAFKSCFMEAKARGSTDESNVLLDNIQNEIKDVCNNKKDFNRYIVEKTQLTLTKENLQSVAEKMVDQKDILYKDKDIFLPKALKASSSIADILVKQGSKDIYDPHINVSDGKTEYLKFAGCLKHIPKLQKLKVLNKADRTKNPEINRSRSSAEPEYSR